MATTLVTACLKHAVENCLLGQSTGQDTQIEILLKGLENIRDRKLKKSNYLAHADGVCP